MEMNELQTDFKLRADPVYFSKVMLDIEPDPWQETVLRYTGKRLLMLCCRQSGKSLMSAILSLHRALYRDKSLILIVSPTLRQSSELFRTINNLVIQVQPVPEKVEDNRLSLTLRNGSRIVSLPSREAHVRGYSAPDVVVIDEAGRVEDAMYFAIRPMIATNDGALILLSTPNGKDGFFYREWTEGKGWEKIRVPSSKCPRISKKFLKEERESIGEMMYRQEYQIEFLEDAGEIISEEYIEKSMVRDFDLFPGEEFT